VEFTDIVFSTERVEPKMKWKDIFFQPPFFDLVATIAVLMIAFRTRWKHAKKLQMILEKELVEVDMHLNPQLIV